MRRAKAFRRERRRALKVAVQLGLLPGDSVPPELTDRIFNPFFTTKPQGSGLGLAIVRKIVDAHDGHIDLYSSATAGTRFRVTLPVSTASSWFK